MHTSLVLSVSSGLSNFWNTLSVQDISMKDYLGNVLCSDELTLKLRKRKKYKCEKHIKINCNSSIYFKVVIFYWQNHLTHHLQKIIFLIWIAFVLIDAVRHTHRAFWMQGPDSQSIWQGSNPWSTLCDRVQFKDTLPHSWYLQIPEF